MGKPRFNPAILREYDIRGIVGSTLDTGIARDLGQAFGTMIAAKGGRSAVLGQDGRLSSPMLANAFARGLRGAGIDVFRIGIGPSPMLYFAEGHLKADAAAMVTGSHNPPEYNGFKLVLGGQSLYGDDLQQLGRLIADRTFASGSGRSIRRSVLGTHVKRLLQDADLMRPLNVVWDPGNGAAAPVVALLAKALPGRHVVLNGAVDGNFPGHHPDPTLPETLEQLRAAVLEQRCDLGIAFDGDGDRIGVIDNCGRILWGDQLMMLWAEDILAHRPGATIIADVKTSQTLFDRVAELGGMPLMWRTGHSLIKKKMRETGAALAGEMSGHIFFADRYYGFDDAAYAAIRLLNIIAQDSPLDGRSLADLHDRLPKAVNTPELRIPVEQPVRGADKFGIIERVKAHLHDAGAQLSDIDGVRVQTDDGWWLLRASNTQEILVGRCEAKTPEALERLKGVLAGELRRAGLTAADIAAVAGLQPAAAADAPEPDSRRRRVA